MEERGRNRRHMGLHAGTGTLAISKSRRPERELGPIPRSRHVHKKREAATQVQPRGIVDLEFLCQILSNYHVHCEISFFCPCNWGTQSARGFCSQGEDLHFGRGTKSLQCFCEEFLGGNGKAEEPKVPGAGIPPKPCPMERVE